MTLGGLALIAVIFVLLVIVLVVVWQGARSLARLRRRGRAGAGVARVGRSLDRELDLILQRVDAVRRSEIPAAEIIVLVSQAVDDVGEALRLVKSLPVAPERGATRDAFELELLHASRALEVILEACLELEGTTQPERHERAMTRLKWGHMNLHRTHQNLADQARVLDDLRASADSEWRESRI